MDSNKAENSKDLVKDVKKKYSDEEREELSKKLAQDLDDYVASLPKKPYTEGWTEENWKEEFDKHPFFMSKPPEDSDALSPLVEGIQELKYDETENSPEELAATYKNEGNFYFKCKKYKQAIINYSQGLQYKCSDEELNANLLNNRSAAHFFLENYRSSYNDCKAALKLKPDYVRVIKRCAKCCKQLSLFEECVEFCNKTLEIVPSDSEMKELCKEAVSQQKKIERDKRKEKALQRKEEMAEKNLIAAINERNIIIYPDTKKITSVRQLEPNFPEVIRKPVHFQDNRLVWPVAFLYPEFDTSDFVQEFHEDSTFEEQIIEMFRDPPDWDVKNEYAPEKIRVYFEDVDRKSHLVSQKSTLGKILSHPKFRLDGGVPAFILFVAESTSESEFLKG